MSLARQVGISIKSKGLILDGIVSYPQDAGGSLPALLLCHPEPHLGGSMDSAVIQSLSRHLNEQGLVTLRFNYRGVGQSQGTTTLGIGEVEDTRAAWKVLRTWPGVDEERAGIVGYSFGAGVAVRAALREKTVHAVVAVSPPLSLPPAGLEGVRGLEALECPLLLVIGEQDGLTTPSQLGEWVAGLRNPRIETAVVPRADRTWQGRGEELADTVGGFLREHLGA